jgi:PAS domain S-box-containing protein
MLGVGVDITHLKQIAHWLLESEEKYRLLLDSTAEAIYGMDMEGNCTFCNPAGLRFLGYASQEDLLGKNMHHLTHHSRPDGSPYPIRECAIYSAIREGVATHRTDEMLWRSDGTGFSVEYWSHPMYKSGQLVGAVVTFLDLSRRESSPLP